MCAKQPLFTRRQAESSLSSRAKVILYTGGSCIQPWLKCTWPCVCIAFFFLKEPVTPEACVVVLICKL